MPEVNPLKEKLWDVSEEFELITTISEVIARGITYKLIEIRFP